MMNNGQAVGASGSLGVLDPSQVELLPELSPQHREKLAASTLTGEYIEGNRFMSAAGYRTPRGTWRACPALVIPYLDRQTGEIKDYCLRPDEPRLGGPDHKPAKYEYRKGQRPRAFFPYGLPPGAELDPSVPLLLVEGQLKAAAAQRAGFASIGFSGAWTWHKRRPKKDKKGVGPRKLLDELAAIDWGGRQVYLVFDSDTTSNVDVAQAEWLFARELDERGARVKIVRLPPGPNGEKVGLDDYLLAKGEAGPAALRRLLDEARRPEQPERVTGQRLYMGFVENSQGVPPRAAQVWFILWGLAGGKDHVRAGQEWIARLAGCDLQTVRRAITELRKRGHLIRPDQLRGEPAQVPMKKGRGSVYFLRPYGPGVTPKPRRSDAAAPSTEAARRAPRGKSAGPAGPESRGPEAKAKNRPQKLRLARMRRTGPVVEFQGQWLGTCSGCGRRNIVVDPDQAGDPSGQCFVCGHHEHFEVADA
jgi:hypothetical protein